MIPHAPHCATVLLSASFFLQGIVDLFAAKTKGGLLFAVDDAHLIGSHSWAFMPAFGHRDSSGRSMLLLTVRSPWHPRDSYAVALIESRSTMTINLTPMRSQHLAALACQLLGVQMIPQRLDQMLRLNSMGVPSWVDLLLREYLYESVIKVSSRIQMHLQEACMQLSVAGPHVYSL
jgi:hypothetical protein